MFIHLAIYGVLQPRSASTVFCSEMSYWELLNPEYSDSRIHGDASENSDGYSATSWNYL